MNYLVFAIKNIIKLAISVIPMILLLFVVYRFIKPKDYIFRKMVHTVLFLGTALMVYWANDYILILLESLIIIIFWYPVFLLVESNKWYQEFFVEKSNGEIKKTLLLLYGAVILMDILVWISNKSILLIVASLLMWGFGDGIAALIGIPYGKHKISIGINKEKKSFEGMISMFLASFICALVIYYLKPDVLSFTRIILASITATITEAFTSSEYDTFSVPIACLLMLLL